MCRDLNQRALEQAIRALTLVLQAGNFGLVVFDVAEAPADAVRRLPFTTWLRLQRMVEGSQTVCVLVGGEPMARSSAGLTVACRNRDQGAGSSDQGEVVEGSAGSGMQGGRGGFGTGCSTGSMSTRASSARGARERDDACVALSTPTDGAMADRRRCPDHSVMHRDSSANPSIPVPHPVA